MTSAYPQNHQEQRQQMVTNQIRSRGIRSPQVLKAMATVPRHEFVPESLKARAYQDRPLPIGQGQTISQPFIVAFMSEQLDLQPGGKILEIGTGSGYQSAILSEMGMEVFTIEILPALAARAKENLRRTGYKRVNCLCGNGYNGWPEEAPFDAILVTAAPETIPQTLISQLKRGGVMILPVGSIHRLQFLKKITKREKNYMETTLLPVRFVPMVKHPPKAENKRPKRE